MQMGNLRAEIPGEVGDGQGRDRVGGLEGEARRTPEEWNGLVDEKVSAEVDRRWLREDLRKSDEVKGEEMRDEEEEDPKEEEMTVELKRTGQLQRLDLNIGDLPEVLCGES